MKLCHEQVTSHFVVKPLLVAKNTWYKGKKQYCPPSKPTKQIELQEFGYSLSVIRVIFQSEVYVCKVCT
jgi:hypothetical protein